MTSTLNSASEAGAAAETIDTGTEMVLARVTDHVGVVTLNRPDRRNALHPDMYRVVPQILERFAADPEVGAVLITGAGTAFCAGGDVRRDKRSSPDDPNAPTIADRAAELTENARMVELLHAMPKVTIAALPGPAVGAGLSIALSTDLRIASRSTRLIPGWGDLGFSGDFGGTWFLTRLVGPSKALEILISGVPVTSDEALSLGLLNRVAPDETLAADALDWARTIAAGPRQAWAATKGNIARATEMELSEALPLESEQMVRSGMTEEHKARVRAWFEAARKKQSEGGASR